MKLTVLVGLPGSGKSTFAEKYAKENNAVILSSDAIRKELYGDEKDQNHNEEVFNELYRRVRNNLQVRNVVFDATNCTLKSRRTLLTNISKISCKKIAICIMTTVEDCLENNQKRERKVPESVIWRMLTNFIPPHKCEGFDEIYFYVNSNQKHLSEYTVNKFLEKASAFDQKNKHHNLTLGEHSVKAASVFNREKDRKLHTIALLHDCGKIETQSDLNGKGEKDGDFHYFNHMQVGAYKSIIMLKQEGYFSESDINDIALVIAYHMRPYCEWKQSAKRREKDRVLIGEYLYELINKVHEADLFAH